MSRVPYVSSEPLLTDAKFQYDTVSSFAKAFDDGRFRVDRLMLFLSICSPIASICSSHDHQRSWYVPGLPKKRTRRWQAPADPLDEATSLQGALPQQRMRIQQVQCMESVLIYLRAPTAFTQRRTAWAAVES